MCLRRDTFDFDNDPNFHLHAAEIAQQARFPNQVQAGASDKTQTFPGIHTDMFVIVVLIMIYLN